MATLMVMPLLGQTMEEGTIIKWFKQEGESVSEGEPLLEVMTDKVNMEVEAPTGGVVRKVLAKQDDVVPVQSPIAIIGTVDEPIDDLLAQAGGAAAEQVSLPAQPTAPAYEPAAPEVSYSPSGGVSPEKKQPGEIISSPAARRVAREKGIDIASLAGRGSGPGGRIIERDVMEYAASVKATPLAGKVAEEHGLEIGAISGTGIGGKVTREDVTRAAARPSPPAPAQAIGIGQTIPFTGLRKMVADNVSRSAREAVHVMLTTEVDMTQAVALRSQVLDEIQRTHGVRVSSTDIIVKAAARAILDEPIVNSSLRGDSIVVHDRVNIGVATAIEGGLVVPVIRDVPAKTLAQVSVEIKEVVGRVRSNEATPGDYTEGTFTITNLGSYGVDVFNPIITPGQSAILGVCRIAEKPVVVDGRVEVRSMMNLCLTFDHRVMDGAPAAEYLARLREILESPYLMFI